MSRLVFKVRSEGIYSSFRFPLKLRPQEDELLSSWLIRLALLHRTMPMTFTNLYMPETKNRFWSVDIDLQSDPESIERLFRKCGVPVEVLSGMTLSSYEGLLIERVYGNTGGTPFIGPLGIRGKRSTLPGLRYCPLCLKDDTLPYYRKKWRLSLSVACPRHRCFLKDRCSSCGTPLTPYLSCKYERLDVCYKCGEKLSKPRTLSISEGSEILWAVEHFYSVLDDGYLMIGKAPVYSHLYFYVLHQLLKLMLSRKYGEKLMDGVGLKQDQSIGYKSFEGVPIQLQAEMLVKAVWLLEEWPERLISVCSRQKLLSSALLRDMNPTPFWYWKEVIERLYQPDRFVTYAEVQEAIRFMEKYGIDYSELALSRMLGVGQVFRRRKKWIG